MHPLETTYKPRSRKLHQKNEDSDAMTHKKPEIIETSCGYKVTSDTLCTGSIYVPEQQCEQCKIYSPSLGEN